MPGRKGNAYWWYVFEPRYRSGQKRGILKIPESQLVSHEPLRSITVGGKSLSQILFPQRVQVALL